eukprot:CAMPEP_0174928778 /NCGR_PEP_ID=MMETSP1355-20121228/25968_1 /TAXON_ID=464990 /ORGANISM="Hemiselmis tepida, Strain CCMP443" /LENGTH=201 /DNA_ID=CAMNT_0016174955 /DNA_START=11 /DNA_END=613 /DNA_ORIENTATION=-
MAGLLSVLLTLIGLVVAEGIDCRSIGLRVAEVYMDGPIKDIVWLEGKVVFALTTKRTLYRSSDDGRKFTNVMSMLQDSDTSDPPFHAGVEAMYPSDADSKRLFFQGAGKTHWVTYDRGESFIRRKLRMPLGGVKMHKTRGDYLLASRMRDRCYAPARAGECDVDLLVSYDFGSSFRRAVRRVSQYDWGPSENTVIYSAFPA